MSCTGQRLPYSKLNVSSIKGLNLCPLQQQRLSVTSTLGLLLLTQKTMCEWVGMKVTPKWLGVTGQQRSCWACTIHLPDVG